jgi:hypothetical protein
MPRRHSAIFFRNRAHDAETSRLTTVKLRVVYAKYLDG